MISGFLTSVIFPPTTPAYRGTPYVDYWFLPSSTPAPQRRSVDKQNNQVDADVLILTLLILPARLLLSQRRVEKVTNELGDNGTIVASITVFVNAPPLYLPRRYAIANAKDCPDALFLCRENGGQQVMFSGIFMSYPNKRSLLYLIRNKVDCSRTNPGYCV